METKTFTNGEMVRYQNGLVGATGYVMFTVPNSDGKDLVMVKTGGGMTSFQPYQLERMTDIIDKPPIDYQPDKGFLFKDENDKFVYLLTNEEINKMHPADVGILIRNYFLLGLPSIQTKLIKIS